MADYGLFRAIKNGVEFLISKTSTSSIRVLPPLSEPAATRTQRLPDKDGIIMVQESSNRIADTVVVGSGNRTIKLDSVDGNNIQLELRNSVVGGLAYLDFAVEVTDTANPDYTARVYAAPTQFVVALPNNVNFLIPNGNVQTNGMNITFGGALQTTGNGLGSVAGNARGAGAVDLQVNRSAATMVASGTYSLLSGINGTASGTASVSLGNANLVAGANSAGFNANNEVLSTTNGGLVHGYQAVARRSGTRVFSSGRIAANGDAQAGEITLRNVTTNATLVELVGGLDTQRIVLQNDSTLTFDAIVTARRTDADNESGGWYAQGVIDRNSGVATVAIVGAVTKTAIAKDQAAWDITIDADTTNGSLRFRVQGEAAKTVYWVAHVRYVEVIG